MTCSVFQCKNQFPIEKKKGLGIYILYLPAKGKIVEVKNIDQET